MRRRATPNNQHNRRLKALYPRFLREKAITGDVHAVLTVLADGTVGNVKIEESPYDAFAESAARVLKQFLFEPAIDHRGKAVASKIRITYRFALD